MQDREARLMVSAETALRLQALASDPAVTEFFESYERRMVKEIVDAEPLDSARRDSAALKLRAMREFQVFLAGKIARGERAKLEFM